MKFFINKLYKYYAKDTNSRSSLIHKLHELFFSSSAIVYLLFRVKINKNLKKQSTYRDYKHKFDLTTILLKIVLKKYVKKNSKILEIGVGSFGILSIYIKNNFDTNNFAIDTDPINLANSKKNISFNKVEINLIKSNIFQNLEEKNFDIIFWNLPYYEDKKKYLYPLLDNANEYLNENAKLIIGYNSTPLKENDIIKHSSVGFLNYLKGVNFKWNNHIISILEKNNVIIS